MSFDAISRPAFTPLPAAVRSQIPATAYQPGPNEQALLAGSDRLSFRFKAAVFKEVDRIDDVSPGLWRGINHVLGHFQKVSKVPQPGNTQVIAPGIMRGEQPNEQGFRWLASQGYKTTINLTEESNYDAKWATAAGLREIYQPQHGFDAPTLTQARDFLKAVTNPANQPVYFHCYHGSDRTGTMAAVYRIAVDGWTADQAIAELGPHHFNTPYEMAKLQFIRDFATQWRGRAVELMASG